MSESLPSLMPMQVREILLVSSLYESFIMAEDGHLAELLLTRFLDLNLSQLPTLTHVASGAEAVAQLRSGRRYDVVISTLQAARLGVPVFIVVEDNVRYYSSFLPTIYAETMKHSQAVVAEGLNLTQKLLLMRARPKILLATNFEEAWADFTAYSNDVLGVISDIEFPRGGELAPTAGIDFARRIREVRPDLALTLQSSFPENERLAQSVQARFLLKGSPLMLQELREQFEEHFAFGDFVFRLNDNSEVGRAHDVRSLAEALHNAPAESIARHAATNHFSTWLRARAEFELARELRPRKISDFESIEHLRYDLIAALERHRRARSRTTVADFDADTFEEGSITRIGSGSLGGKARGLAFATRLLTQAGLAEHFPDVNICVPTAAVIGTDIFEEFLSANALRDVALGSENDADIEAAFAAARFPRAARASLKTFIKRVRRPIVVRSSSRLEDSPSLPYAGVFDTYMLPNDANSDEVRVDQLIAAIKRVYASTFNRAARSFIRGTSYRLEEEQMAVVVQELVGSRHGNRFYPDFAGVGRSHNFYPVPPLTTEEGIVAVALGLGLTVVNGEPCVRFSPAHPHHIVELSSARDMLHNTQREFWAVQLGNNGRNVDWSPNQALVRFTLEAAERDGVLPPLASTYSVENDAVYDGVGRNGTRLVSFAPILKHGVFPLAEILRAVLALGVQGTGSPAEIEFAVNLSVPSNERPVFGLVQLRPLAGAGYLDEIDIDGIPDNELICRSSATLGNGGVSDVRDLVIVDPRSFVRGRGYEAARAVARFNAELSARAQPYVLLGAGRWGSADPWLGIPVSWPDIAGARAIVEVAFRDFKVAPSQGTHFFQNIVSGNVGYFTINSKSEGFVDWDWLAQHPSLAEDAGVRHVRLAQPLTVLMNGRTRRGVIRKPNLEDLKT